nr:hypothetical protein [uncultured Rhodopila sp.]
MSSSGLKIVPDSAAGGSSSGRRRGARTGSAAGGNATAAAGQQAGGAETRNKTRTMRDILSTAETLLRAESIDVEAMRAVDAELRNPPVAVDAGEVFEVCHRSAELAQRLGQTEVASYRWKQTWLKFPDNTWFLAKFIENATDSGDFETIIIHHRTMNKQLKRAWAADPESVEGVLAMLRRATKALFDNTPPLGDSPEVGAFIDFVLDVDMKMSDESILHDIMYHQLKSIEFNRERFLAAKSFLDKFLFRATLPETYSRPVAILYLASVTESRRPEFDDVFERYIPELSLKELEAILGSPVNRDLSGYLKNALTATAPGCLMLEILDFINGMAPEKRADGSSLNRLPRDVRHGAALRFLAARELGRFAANDPAVSPAAVRGGRKRKRLAVCVSGQLRGFETAFASWQETILSNVEHDIYVATWGNRGGKELVPVHADRVLPPRTAAIYFKQSQKLGNGKVRSLYPALHNAVVSSRIVHRDYIENVYGTRAVALFNESNVELVSNDDRMFYLMDQAQTMMLKSGIVYDTVLRIRPDKEIIEGDLQPAIEELCSLDAGHKRILVSDMGKPYLMGLEGLCVGDQMALSTMAGMEDYARIWNIRNLARMQVAGFEIGLHAHRSLAYALLGAGVEVRHLQVWQGHLLDASSISAEQVRSLILTDCANRMNETDRVMLEALEFDQAASTEAAEPD